MSPENESLPPHGITPCVGLACLFVAAPILWHSPPIGACHKIGPATSGPSPAVCDLIPWVEDLSMALALPLLLRSGSFLFVPVPPLASSSFRIHPQRVQSHLSQLARPREHQRAVCARERRCVEPQHGRGKKSEAERRRAPTEDVRSPWAMGGASSFCIDPGAMISMAPLIRSLVCFYLLLSNLNVWLWPRR